MIVFKFDLPYFFDASLSAASILGVKRIASDFFFFHPVSLGLTREALFTQFKLLVLGL